MKKGLKRRAMNSSPRLWVILAILIGGIVQEDFDSVFG